MDTCSALHGYPQNHLTAGLESSPMPSHSRMCTALRRGSDHGPVQLPVPRDPYAVASKAWPVHIGPVGFIWDHPFQPIKADCVESSVPVLGFLNDCLQ